MRAGRAHLITMCIRLSTFVPEFQFRAHKLALRVQKGPVHSLGSPPCAQFSAPSSGHTTRSGAKDFLAGFGVGVRRIRVRRIQRAVTL
jgi:hypothetical protein